MIQFVVQMVDLGLLEKLKSTLKQSKTSDFLPSTTKEEIEMNQEMKSKYSIFTKIMSSLVRNGKMGEFLVSIIEHTEKAYINSPNRKPYSYLSRKKGKIDSQHFPNFPLLRERARYKRACRVEDRRSLNKMCEKNFPGHSSLTPGLMVMTCACSEKVVYGFSMMLSGESSQMLFDIIRSRFPKNYNPQIIHDNSFKIKEYGFRVAERWDLEVLFPAFSNPN